MQTAEFGFGAPGVMPDAVSVVSPAAPPASPEAVKMFTDLLAAIDVQESPAAVEEEGADVQANGAAACEINASECLPEPRSSNAPDWMRSKPGASFTRFNATSWMTTAATAHVPAPEMPPLTLPQAPSEAEALKPCAPAVSREISDEGVPASEQTEVSSPAAAAGVNVDVPVSGSAVVIPPAGSLPPSVAPSLPAEVSVPVQAPESSARLTAAPAERPHVPMTGQTERESAPRELRAAREDRTQSANAAGDTPAPVHVHAAPELSTGELIPVTPENEPQDSRPALAPSAGAVREPATPRPSGRTANFNAFSGTIQRVIEPEAPAPVAATVRAEGPEIQLEQRAVPTRESSGGNRTEPSQHVTAETAVPLAGTGPEIRYEPHEPSLTEAHEATPVRTVPEPATSQATGPVNRLTVSVPGENDTRTDIQFVHRNGTVNLDVRTTEPEVAHNLQRALPDLMRTLDANGYKSEVRASADAVAADSSIAVEPVAAAGPEVRAENEPSQGDSDRRRNPYSQHETQDQGGRRNRRQQEKYEDELYTG
ncbi:MAG TPA: hypothetical protein VES20_22785 [Bryobacteraceae bacterium]|nr:hypothetical protein [Bryobacteraceae bacterium]